MVASISRSRFGEILVEEIAPEPGTPLADVLGDEELAAYAWRPNEHLCGELPENFWLGMRSLRGPNGIRRFMPQGDPGGFVINAAAAGAAILTQHRRLDPVHRSTYRVMRMVFQMAPALQEFFERDFRNEQSLYVARSDTERTVLPSTLGLSPGRDGHAWDVSGLMSEGRRRAQMLGRTGKLPSSMLIHLGLLEAALRDPMSIDGLSQAEALTNVRMALFDMENVSRSIDPAICSLVDERFLGALEKHLKDDSEKFNRWMFRNVSNIVLLISKAKTGGTVSREDVRSAISSRVFDAYQYVGSCLSLWAQDFERALPDKYALTDAERSHFSFQFEMHPWLGGLPLMLLYPRFDFLEEFFRAVDEAPTDPRWPGVLLRLLAYYGQMATLRRKDDRDHKKRGLHRNDEGRRATKSSTQINEIAATSGDDDFQEIAKNLRERREVHCPCRRDADWVASSEGIEERPIRLRMECLRCGRVENLFVDENDFRSAGDWLLKETDTSGKQ